MPVGYRKNPEGFEALAGCGFEEQSNLLSG
jgi:hypothetical protein